MKTDQKINQKNSTKLKLSTTLVKYVALATVISALVIIIVFLMNNLISNKDAVADNTKGTSLVTIGTSTSSKQVPISRKKDNSVYEVIYLQSEIATLGDITQLAFYKASGNNSQTISNVKIYLKHTTTTQFNNGNYSVSGYTLAYSGAFPNSSTGWNEITLNNAFTYNNTANLQMLVINDQSKTNQYPKYRYTNASKKARFKEWDGSSNQTNLKKTSSRTNIKLVISTSSTPPPPPPQTGIAPVKGDLIISEFASKGHLGVDNNEFIELYNLSESTLDLSHVSLALFDKDRKGKKKQKGDTLYLTGTLLPDSFYVIAVRNKSNKQPTSALSYDAQSPADKWELKKKSFVELRSDTTIIDYTGSLFSESQNVNYERTDYLEGGDNIGADWAVVNYLLSSPGKENISDAPQITSVSTTAFTEFGSESNNKSSIKMKSKGSVHPGNTKVKIKRGKEHKHKPSGSTMIKRYVEIDPSNQPDNVEMVYHYNESELNGLNESALKLYSYYNNAWHYQGGVVDAVNNTITCDMINHFSDWGAGEASGALPIELLSFDAYYNGKTIDLSWSTASEINNDYFTIERSKDAKNYEVVGTVIGAGNSNITLNYNYKDETSLTGTVYYKLKQTDFNGKFEYFPPVAVNIADNSSVQSKINISVVSPNPFNNEFSVEFETPNPEPIIVYLYNMRGQMVYKDIYSPTEGKNRYTYNDNKNLPAGYYVIAMKQKDTWAKGIKLLKR